MTRYEDQQFEQMARDLQTTIHALEIERENIHELCSLLVEKGHKQLLIDCLLELFHDGKIGWQAVGRLSHLSEEELRQGYHKTLVDDDEDPVERLAKEQGKTPSEVATDLTRSARTTEKT